MTRHIIGMCCFHWIPTRVGQFGAGVPPLIDVVSVLLYWQKAGPDFAPTNGQFL